MVAEFSIGREEFREAPFPSDSLTVALEDVVIQPDEALIATWSEAPPEAWREARDRGGK